jgi:probable rRNA maturation factor
VSARKRRPATPVALTWAVRERPLSDRALRAAVRAALAHGERTELALSVALVSDAELARIHAEFLDDPSPTDVIAFDLSDEQGESGEIYVSVDCARRVGRQRGVGAARELALYLVHGTLHLCGYDDHSLRRRTQMRRAEELVLRALGYADDPGLHP